MKYRKEKKSFALFNIATAAAEEAALAVALVWILPQFGINIPLWAIIILVIGWLCWSYFTYRIGARNIDKQPVVGIEALIGVKCRTSTPLSPLGYLKVGSELWQAHLLDGETNSDVEVTIVEVKGLTLLVKKTSDACGNAIDLSKVH
jgi:membrane-bound ClpP family serine protease